MNPDIEPEGWQDAAWAAWEPATTINNIDYYTYTTGKPVELTRPKPTPESIVADARKLNTDQIDDVIDALMSVVAGRKRDDHAARP